MAVYINYVDSASVTFATMYYTGIVENGLSSGIDMPSPNTAAGISPVFRITVAESESVGGVAELASLYRGYPEGLRRSYPPAVNFRRKSRRIIIRPISIDGVHLIQRVVGGYRTLHYPVGRDPLIGIIISVLQIGYVVFGIDIHPYDSLPDDRARSNSGHGRGFRRITTRWGQTVTVVVGVKIGGKYDLFEIRLALR